MSRLILASGTYGEKAAFELLFDSFIDSRVLDYATLTDKDTILYSGGYDISPTIYKEDHYLGNNAQRRMLSDRDIHEVELFEQARKKDAKFLGVCRGSQLLFALAGGKLFQHVTGHNDGDHYICTERTYPKKYIAASSSHHQMWDLQTLPVPFLLLAHARKQSDRYIRNSTDNALPDPPNDVQYEGEMLYIPDIKGLLIQGHPEYMDYHQPYPQFCRNQVRKHLLGEDIDV